MRSVTMQMHIRLDGYNEFPEYPGAGRPTDWARGLRLFEVWVDPNWTGPQSGGFYQPFNNLPAAVNAVANGGTMMFAPGTVIASPIVLLVAENSYGL